MRDKKNKKFWREKVTAEIGLVHVKQFAQELGTQVTTEEVAAFLNQSGVAQSLWIHMMQAGEQYIKSNLKCQMMHLPDEARMNSETRMIH
jgi:hypothetical protein